MAAPIPAYGTLSVIDSLATYNNTSVLEFGEDKMAGYVRLILDSYNAITAEVISDIVEPVTDRETTYGINTTIGAMVELDEYGLADAQKTPFSPSAVGFPLKRVGATIQWTRDYLATTTPVELAKQVLDMTLADQLALYNAIRVALFRATNNTAYLDRLVDSRAYTIRALANADSQGIPPNRITGATFDASTHTHYVGTASFIEANLTALEETIREHGLNGGVIRVYINAAQEATVRGFSGFNPYVDTRIVYATDANRAVGTVDLINVEDRAIGFHGPAEVWVKPWVPASYVLAFVYGGANQKPLGWRKPEGIRAGFADLRLVAALDRHPLHADAYERYYGFAGLNRVGGAALFTGSGTYASYAP